MRLGLSLRSAHDVGDVRAGARWMVERARAARAADLDSLFVGDHHVVGIPYYQNSPILGRLLAEWGSKPAGALYLLPLWHPVLLAEQVGTLASLAAGRFVLQCAIGDGKAQFAGMGAALSERARRFEAALPVIRRLLAGEEVTAEVGPVSLRGARINPLPPEEVEVWMGGHAAPALDRAARMGDAWIAGPGAPEGRARELLEAYRDRCRAHGRDPRAAIRRDVHVGRDTADAHRVADPVLAAGYRGFAPEVPVVGGPEEVAEELGRFGEMGFEEVLVRHLSPDQAEVLASCERLAEVRALVADA